MIRRYFERYACPPKAEQVFVASVSDVKSCKNIYAKGYTQSGIYAIKRSSGDYMAMRCNMDLEGKCFVCVKGTLKYVLLTKQMSYFKTKNQNK